MKLQDMTRKDLRNYLKHHPHDQKAWEILFKKVDQAPKTVVLTEQIDQVLQERA